MFSAGGGDVCEGLWFRTTSGPSVPSVQGLEAAKQAAEVNLQLGRNLQSGGTIRHLILPVVAPAESWRRKGDPDSTPHGLLHLLVSVHNGQVQKHD